MQKLATFENRDLSLLSKEELCILITQLEREISNMIHAEIKDTIKIRKLNKLIGDVINLFTTK